jgi:hypothetical protein
LSSSLTPEQRRLRGQIGAAVSWANTTSRTARTAPGHAGLRKRFELEVDPAGTLPPEERAKRAEQAFKAHMLKLSYKSSRARSKAAQARRHATELETEAATVDAELGKLNGHPAA